jgi:SAM-dependent methyltransferase
MNIKLDIGCGKRCREGYIGIDKVNFDNVVYAVDIDVDDTNILPFKDCEVETINCEHVLEHIHNLIPVMNEFHRVLKPNGLLEIGVPCAFGYDNNGSLVMGGGAFRDPTHVRFFTQDTFYYWTEGYMGNADYGIRGYYKVISAELMNEVRSGHLPGLNFKIKLEAIK